MCIIADNVDISEGSGKTIAGDEIDGVIHQRVKITQGADGVNDGDVSSANPLPVSDNTVNTTLGSPAQAGEAASATSSLALESGGNLAAIKTDVDKIPSKGQATMANSTPVTIASDQSVFSVSIGWPATGSKVNDTETSAQTDKELIADPGAGVSIYITDIIVSNGATAGYILFEEDTASAKTVVIPKLYLGINGGAVMNFTKPIKITAHKNFGFTSNTVTTHTILINYYTV